MPKVNAKRQVILPIAGCEELGIKAGDEVEILIFKNHFTIFKSEIGLAAGFLKGIKTNKSVDDKQSIQSHFE